jgi:hypothetical protein
MRRDPLDESAQSFADLITNLLAILIIVTLILIAFVKSAAAPLNFAADIAAERDRVLALGRLGGVQTFSGHFYVAAAGVFELDMSKLAGAITALNDSDKGVAGMLGDPWGEVSFSVLPSLRDGADEEMRSLSQDPGQYRVELTVPKDIDSPQPMPAEAVRRLVEERAYALGRTPNFIVAPSGFDVFMLLERQLVAELRCFRWSFTLNREVIFIRTSQSARNFAARRCTQ